MSPVHVGIVVQFRMKGDIKYSAKRLDPCSYRLPERIRVFVETECRMTGQPLVQSIGLEGGGTGNQHGSRRDGNFQKAAAS